MPGPGRGWQRTRAGEQCKFACIATEGTPSAPLHLLHRPRSPAPCLLRHNNTRTPHCASPTAPCRLPPTCTLWRSATGANSQLNCDCFSRLLRLLRTATAERCRRPVLLRQQQQQPLPLLARPLRGGPRCRPLAVAPRSVLLRCRCCRCPHRQLPPARPCKRTQVPFHAFGDVDAGTRRQTAH